MAEVLASLKKIGGNGEQYTETSLWTNSAPTSNFGAQAVTLSQSIADFKYLKIKVAPSTTSTSSQYFEDIILVSELLRTQSSAQEGVRDRLVLGLARTTYDYERSYYYASNTSIYFMATTQSGTSTTSNSRIIPTEILGINELAHQTIVGMYDTTLFKQVAGNVAPSFTTKGTAKAIWLIMAIPNTRTDIFTNVNPYTGEIDNNSLYRCRSTTSAWETDTHSFVVTNNSVSLNSYMSSSAYYYAIAYTYE